MLDNNLKLVDLTDLESGFPLDVADKIQILSVTEEWERSAEKPPLDSLGYPSIVKNDRGRKTTFLRNNKGLQNDSDGFSRTGPVDLNGSE